jgi:hypothetical protein
MLSLVSLFGNGCVIYIFLKVRACHLHTVFLLLWQIRPDLWLQKWQQRS